MSKLNKSRFFIEHQSLKYLKEMKCLQGVGKKNK